MDFPLTKQPSAITEKGTERRGDEDRKTEESRGTTQQQIQRLVDEALGGNDKYFLKDLVDSQSRDPLSPQRAAEIEERSNLPVPNVRDVKSEKLLGGLAMLGVEVVLTVATFNPATALPAYAVSYLLALGEARRGNTPMMMAAMFPVGPGRFARLVKIIPSLQRAAATVPRTMKGYEAAARAIFSRKYPKADALKDLIHDVPKSYQKAVKAAQNAYNRAIKEGMSERQAYSKAGSAFHKMRKAAGPGEGIDFKTSEYIMDLKTHYNPILDKLVIETGHNTVLGYVLKDLVNNQQLRRGLVEHVFIDLKTGKAVRLVVDVVDDKLMKLLSSVP